MVLSSLGFAAISKSYHACPLVKSVITEDPWSHQSVALSLFVQLVPALVLTLIPPTAFPVPCMIAKTVFAFTPDTASSILCQYELAAGAGVMFIQVPVFPTVAPAGERNIFPREVSKVEVELS